MQGSYVLLAPARVGNDAPLPHKNQMRCTCLLARAAEYHTGMESLVDATYFWSVHQQVPDPELVCWPMIVNETESGHLFPLWH